MCISDSGNRAIVRHTQKKLAAAARSEGGDLLSKIPYLLRQLPLKFDGLTLAALSKPRKRFR